MKHIETTINGRRQNAIVSPRTSLADFLRDQLGLTGTHLGCEHGICGACTVMINGEISRSCITYAVACDGAEVHTIEGLDDDPLMEALRLAFIEDHALQCGYCTPGMLITARDLITRFKRLTPEMIRQQMSGNLCRCTGYRGIVRAIARVAADPSVSRASPVATNFGPAPGPRGHSTSQTNGSRSPVPNPNSASLSETVHPPTAPLPIDQIPADWLTVRHTFHLHYPRAQVWALVSDPERVCAALPGIELQTPIIDGNLVGKAVIRLGPIAPSFAFRGTYHTSYSDYTATMSGEGSDRRTRSRVRGRAKSELLDLSDGRTQITFEIAYAVNGPLAQFGRAGVVQDLVARMAKRFANNVETALSGGHPGTNADQHTWWQGLRKKLKQLIRAN